MEIYAYRYVDIYHGDIYSMLKKVISLPRYLENTRKKLMCRTLEIMKYASFTSSIKTNLNSKFII